LPLRLKLPAILLYEFFVVLVHQEARLCVAIDTGFVDQMHFFVFQRHTFLEVSLKLLVQAQQVSVLFYLKLSGVLNNLDSFGVNLVCTSGSSTSVLVCEVLFVLRQAQRRLGFRVIEFVNFVEICHHLRPHLHWVNVDSNRVQVFGASKRVIMIFFILHIVKSLPHDLALLILEKTLRRRVL
jgi:hypothetical protein